MQHIDLFYCFSDGESTEFAMEIDRFTRLVCSSETTFDCNATVFDVLLFSVKRNHAYST